MTSPQFRDHAKVFNESNAAKESVQKAGENASCVTSKWKARTASRRALIPMLSGETINKADQD